MRRSILATGVVIEKCNMSFRKLLKKTCGRKERSLGKVDLGPIWIFFLMTGKKFRLNSVGDGNQVKTFEVEAVLYKEYFVAVKDRL